MKRLMVFGNSSYARRLKKYIDFTQFGEVYAFVVDKEYITDTLLDGIDVISFEEFEEQMKPKDVELVLGIGYSQMGDLRKRIFEMYRDKGYSFANYIHSSVTISPDIVLGGGNVILEGAIIEPCVSIGDANIIFSGSTIGHDSAIGNYNTFGSKVLVSSNNRIDNNCYLGDCSVLSPEVVIEDYVFTGTMTYVNRNLKSGTVVLPNKNKILEGQKSKKYFQMFIEEKG